MLEGALYLVSYNYCLSITVLKFTDLVKFKTAIFMYQAYHCMLPVNLQKNFVKQSNLHATRSKLQLTRTCILTNVRAMSFTVYGIKLWNSLSPDLKNVMSINVFKKNEKKCWFVNTFSQLLHNLCLSYYCRGTHHHKFYNFQCVPFKRTYNC